MKRQYLMLLLLIAAMSIGAVPVKRTTRQVTLADGTQITVTVCGDENGLRFYSANGQELQPSADGRYAYITQQDIMARKYSQLQAANINATPRRIGLRSTAPLPSVGTVNIPVVLVQFDDRSFIEPDPTRLKEDFNLFFNGDNYTAHGSTSSVRDYFIHESDGQFMPHFEILGPVTLDQGYAYYGKNEGYRIDINYTTFRTEALQKLTASQSDIDWSVFDNGGNGDVDMVFFMFAGTGENITNNPDEIWPKESTNKTQIGDITFESSAICSEAYPAEGYTDDNDVVVVTKAKLNGIGVILHELMHALGLPDFYDTSVGSTPVYGMDLFSIMDYGEYTNNGYSPCGLTAYERDFLGWRQLQEITEAGHYQLQPSNATGSIGYKITNSLNPNEYYILEYRAATGNDTRMAKYAHGMTVTHVDYNKMAWTTNCVNNDPSHQRMTPLPAAGEGIGVGWIQPSIPRSKWLADLGFVPFPGKGEVDSLTNNNPLYPAVTYTGRYMSKPIFDIQEDVETQIVTFSFLQPSLEDAIETLWTDEQRAVWFNLDGRRVEGSPTRPGIYICNNKKIIKR